MIRMVDIIQNKQRNTPLTEEEIAFFVRGVTDESIPDYQTAALLMAIYYSGMDKAETALLTRYMAQSGDVIDLSAIRGVKVDKHSTGGVGDKTTLVVAPLVAACGGKVAKMSGRGLAHTGGTVDKLESIPGLKTEIDRQAFVDIVNRVGVCVIGQSGNLAPADKKLYALRDVTSTVQSIPLIASSIMSKKLAAGSDAILLDVKTGSGAFMKTRDDAVELAKAMVDIGESEGRRTAALVTDMDIPLGRAIGNSLEVVEVVETLRGNGPRDLTDLCVLLAADMLALSGIGDETHCARKAAQALESGAGFAKLKEMVAAQGGNASVLDDTSKFAAAPVRREVKAVSGGYISQMDTERCGKAAAMLGAGRMTKEDSIDHSAGIVLREKTGNFVEKGSVVAELFTSSEDLVPGAEAELLDAIVIAAEPAQPRPVVLARVTAEGVSYE